VALHPSEGQCLDDVSDLRRVHRQQHPAVHPMRSRVQWQPAAVG
jgi:hypothetical protein